MEIHLSVQLQMTKVIKVIIKELFLKTDVRLPDLDI